MLMILFCMPIFMLLVSLWVFVSKRKHLMSMLISLEYVALTGFFVILLVSCFSGLESYLCLIFLISSVCEGSLGVSILVNMVRSYGVDYLNSMSVLKC
uniref:NADH-ubiquinone oxidoreductase chain 4L n=1 Tax=Glyptelasma annandalei TaxID=2590147 RepID=A0A4Y5UZ25_9CRUS|nr:NADH dehydrogenase subunit 4L [Glyptelasma annandalei]QDD68304.1 NADH dehydrogenase subunit 4L [Glyptelasma annandalei]